MPGSKLYEETLFLRHEQKVVLGCMMLSVMVFTVGYVWQFVVPFKYLFAVTMVYVYKNMNI